MIKKTIRMSDCVGKYATLDHSIKNGAGQCIKKGSKVKIVDYGRSLSIQTDICTQCGQSCYIRGVKKEELTLCDENNEPFWITVKDIIQCSKCGFGMSAGRMSYFGIYPNGYYNRHIDFLGHGNGNFPRDYNGNYKPNFCPNCGRYMKNKEQTHE